MRLAVITDIHGNLHALEAVLADLAQQGAVDRTWFLGDLCVNGSRPAECLRRVRDLPNVQALAGNQDRRIVTGQRSTSRPKDAEDYPKWREILRWRDETYLWTVDQLSYAEWEWLAKLPSELELNVPGYGWVIGYHGTPGDDEGNLRPETPDDEALDYMLDREGRMGIGGHTHVAMDRTVGGWRLLNAGSVGRPKDDPRPTYLIVTFEGGAASVEIRRVAYDVEAEIADLKTCGNPAWAWCASDILR